MHEAWCHPWLSDPHPVYDRYSAVTLCRSPFEVLTAKLAEHGRCAAGTYDSSVMVGMWKDRPHTQDENRMGSTRSCWVFQEFWGCKSAHHQPTISLQTEHQSRTQPY